MDTKELHEKILYPIVRVKSQKAGGSGTVIYSEKDPEKPEEYQTFVLTNCHVVDDAISTKKDWDSLIKKFIEKEFLASVYVDTFNYAYQSTVISANTHNANIIAYDKYHDIALLKLDSPQKHEYVAKLVPKEKIPDIKLFTSIWCVGASLLHEPFANPGYITFLKEMIENRLYFMTNANMIFGNSGGAILLADTGELIGIPARITGIQLGFGVDIITWMSFMIAPQRMYEFFKEQCLFWLYDKKYTFKECLKLREEKEQKAKFETLKESTSTSQNSEKEEEEKKE